MMQQRIMKNNKESIQASNKYDDKSSKYRIDDTDEAESKNTYN